MSRRDAARWNERYDSEGNSWLRRSPRNLLLNNDHLLPKSGIALDAAAGVATNGLYLARQGLHVIAMDISESGLRLAIQRANAIKARLEAVVVDLSQPCLPASYFDVILNFYYLERATIPVYRRALKPAGLLFFETFVRSHDAAPYSTHYLEPGELLSAFGAWEILHWEQSQRKRELGRPPRLTEKLIVRKSS